jgi:UDPglucose 6-dehydrogenase
VKLGIVGYGVVGSALAKLFRAAHEVVIFDKFLAPFSDDAHRHAVNDCDLAFLSVPTPAAGDCLSCDLSAVEECAQWIQAPLCIRSTVVPGTTDRLSALTKRPIAFSPVYIGETPDHPWRDEGACGFLIVGGPPSICDLFFLAYGPCLPSEIRFYRTSAPTAELCKYMENCFLATKVAFVNQFFDIATSLNVDFEELRNLWLLDSRVGPSHTVVTPERGFRGRCLPKDVAALIAVMGPLGGAPLLEAVHSYNERLCEEANLAHVAQKMP